MAANPTTSSSARWAALACPLLLTAGALAGGSIFETQVLDHPAPTANQDFGVSVGLSGALAIVGSSKSSPNGGQAFIFERSGGTWSLTQTLASGEPLVGNRFGASVDIETPYAVVGAPKIQAGRAFVYEDKLGEGWVPRDTLAPSDAVEGNLFDFGASVGMSGDVIVVGAPAAPGGGRAYVFRRDGLEWNEEAILVGSGNANGHAFGRSVDVDGDNIIIGAPGSGANGAGSGRVYIFSYTGPEGVGSPWQEVLASTPAAFDNGDALGSSVAISGALAVAGAPVASVGAGAATGSVQVFSFDGNAWAPAGEFKAAGVTAFNGFGGAVDLDRGQLVVGAVAFGGTQGAAFLFVNDAGATFTEQATLQHANPGVIDSFASTLAVSGDTALAGAPANDAKGSNVGRAYIYEGLFTGVDCPGDVNGDLTVNSTDLNMVLAGFGSSDAGDADGDGDTDSSDLNIVLGNFGETCGPIPQ